MQAPQDSEILQLMEKGQRKLNAGEFYKALEALTEAWQKAQEKILPNEGAPFETLALICECYFEMGEFDNAQVMADQLMSVSARAKSPKGIALALGNLAKSRIVQGNYAGAKSLLQQAHTIIKSIDDELLLGWSLHNLGIMAFQEGDYRNAVNHFKEALSLRENLGDKIGFAQSKGNLAMVYATIGKKQDALELYSEALHLFESINRPVGIAATLSNLALFHSQYGHHEDAELQLKKALALYRKIKHSRGAAITLLNLSSLQVRRGDYDRALTSLNKAKEDFEQLGDMQGVASCLQKLGDISRERLQTRQARKNYEEAIKIFQRLGNRRGEAMVWESMGRLEYRRKNQIVAKTLYEQCLDIYQEMHSQEDLVTHLCSYSAVLIDLQEYQQAREVLMRAENLAQSHQSIQENIRVSIAKSELEKELGPPSQAYKDLDNVLQLSKKIGVNELIVRSAVSLSDLLLTSYLDLFNHEDFNRLLDLVDEAIRLSEGHPAPQAYLLLVQGQILVLVQELERALQSISQAESFSQKLADMKLKEIIHKELLWLRRLKQGEEVLQENSMNELGSRISSNLREITRYI